ncbi:MAG: TetR/AcrR family transcriptional regulator [Sphingomonadales bacterium]
MPKLDDARTQILTTAQQLAQRRGYGGFSFRDIAKEVGIKSASIHYHFPTKDDLVVALVDGFMDGFFGTLSDFSADNPNPKEELNEFICQLRTVLDDQERMCLCGMMAAEIALLSPRAQERTLMFFDRAETWLEKRFEAIGASDPKERATDMLARLEGVLLIARAKKDVSKFDAVARLLKEEIAQL